MTKYHTFETLTRDVECAGSQHHALLVRQCLWVGAPHKKARNDRKYFDGTDYDTASSNDPRATDSQNKLGYIHMMCNRRY
eukprot:6176576-Pleurochrysis_carterae.AAC.1